MEYSALEIATLINGEIIGNPDTKVNNLSKIEEGRPGTISFMANLKYEDYIYNTDASIVIVNKSFSPKHNVNPTLIKVDDAYQAFASLLKEYNTKANGHYKGIDNQAYVSNSAKVSNSVTIGAFSYIGDNVEIGENSYIYPQVYIAKGTKIGKNVVLHPGVKIYENTVIGDRSIIHSNCVIGADGFGFTKQSDGSYHKVSQIGNVVIEEDVEIGACTTIDSATLGSTIIRKGVKLDNLIQIAHNVEIGENTAMAALVGVSGSTKIGKGCVIAGQVGLTGHIEIGDNITIGAQAGVTKSFTTEGMTLLGAPAYDMQEAKKIFIATRRMPDMLKKISNLEAELEKLKRGFQDNE